MADETVDGYIASLPGWQADVVSRLRDMVRAAAPGAIESIKWAQPVYETNGPFCYIKAFKTSVNLGFWRGVDIDDPQGLLQGTGEKMRHVPLTGPDDIDAPALGALVRQAVQLNMDQGTDTKGS